MTNIYVLIETTGSTQKILLPFMLLRVWQKRKKLRMKREIRKNSILVGSVGLVLLKMPLTLKSIVNTSTKQNSALMDTMSVLMTLLIMKDAFIIL